MYRSLRLARRILAMTQEELVQFLAKRYEVTPNSVAYMVKEAPSPLAAEWFVKEHARNPVLLQGMKDLFDHWQRHKGDNRYQNIIKEINPNVQPRNILTIPHETLKEAEVRLNTAIHAPSKREMKQKVKTEGTKVVYDTPPFKVIKIGGDPNKIDQAAQAACYYAAGTRWCVSDPETAKDYLQEDPLYLVLENNQKVALLHINSRQLMSVDDNPISPEDELGQKLYPLFAQMGLLINRQEIFQGIEKDIVVFFRKIYQEMKQRFPRTLETLLKHGYSEDKSFDEDEFQEFVKVFHEEDFDTYAFDLIQSKALRETPKDARIFIFQWLTEVYDTASDQEFAWLHIINARKNMTQTLNEMKDSVSHFTSGERWERLDKHIQEQIGNQPLSANF